MLSISACLKSPSLAAQGRRHAASVLVRHSSSQPSFLTKLRVTLGMDPPPPPGYPTDANRFHPWDRSPCPQIAARAEFIKAKAKCPVTGKNIAYTCPTSGIPTHHDRAAWEADEEYHRSGRAQLLRKANVLSMTFTVAVSFRSLTFLADSIRTR